MRRTAVSAIAAVALMLGFMPAATADEGTHSPNIEHVQNIGYEARHQNTPNQGTDLEFIEITLSGDAVRELAKRDGNVEDGNADVAGIQRTYSVAGSYNNGMHLVDITDPSDTFVAGVYDCGISQGDVQVFKRTDAEGVEHTYATYTWDNGYTGRRGSACFTEAAALGMNPKDEGTFIADISNPYAPTTVSFITVPKGSHNGTVHPSGDYFYNSNSELITNAAAASIEVYDIRDFSNPELVATLPIVPKPGLGTDSHDITFNTEGTRAYSAALSQGLIINTEDPANPSTITSFVDPAINVWHQSDPVTLTDKTTGMERTFLVVEDEVAGATPTGQCPNGGVHVYDITGPLELAPVKVGYWNIDQPRVFSADLGCTAHVFDLHEDEGIMTIAYYQGGVRVVDISGLIGVALGANGVGMKELAYYYFGDEGGINSGADEGASDTWAFKAPFVDRDGVFYAYGNDQNRGFDVYKVDLTSPSAASTNPGIWLSPAEALEMSESLPDTPLAKPFCLLGERA